MNPNVTYICPMHLEVRESKPGRCPKCGMKLVPEGTASQHSDHHNSEPQEAHSYVPLFIIIAMITLVTATLALDTFLIGTLDWQVVMMNFMAGFFLVFSGFKLLDLKGFAEGYSTYDVIAKRFFGYGYIYPFIELGLGLSYALHIDLPLLYLVTFLVMAISGIGVAIKLFKNEPFQCACLGTFLKVPLTKVTLIEDFGMAAMALVMFINAVYPIAIY